MIELRYYTREMYEKDQIVSWLSLDTTTFRDMGQWNYEDGIDTESWLHEEDKLLVKYMPEHLRERIHSIRDAVNLSDNDPDELHLAEELKNWCNAIKQEHIENGKAYAEYLNTIRPILPKDVEALSRMGLHDALLLAISKPSNNTVIFELDCSGACPPQGKCTMAFSGVKLFTISDTTLPKWWTCEELALTEDTCFNLQVLFNNGECELVAENLALAIEPEQYEET